MSALAKLHNESYSQKMNYYSGLTDTHREVRKTLLSAVLGGENGTTLKIASIGPQYLARPVLSALQRDSRILDVGCAIGDNLKLMSEKGFKRIFGIDVAQGMIEEARKRVDAEFQCVDLFQFQPSEKFDLVTAQAFVHLFPKHQLKEVLVKLLDLSKQRVHFSTTLHEKESEGMEIKEDVIRYRSRYTLPKILQVAGQILAETPQMSFHYFILNDPVGKPWINVIFERDG